MTFGNLERKWMHFTWGETQITVGQRADCGRLLLTRLPTIPSTWHSHSCKISSTWVWDEPGDLHLINRIKHKWWNVTSKIRLYMIVISILLVLSGSSWVLFLMTLAGDAHMARKWTYPLISHQQRTADLTLEVFEELNSAKSHTSELRSRSFPNRAFWWDCSPRWTLHCYLVRYPDAEDRPKPCLNSRSSETPRQ